MGISVKKRRKVPNRQRGFSLLEQMIAAGLIVTGSICVLESIVFCLITLQVSEKKWEEGLALWNEKQVELSEHEEIDETSEDLEESTEP